MNYKSTFLLVADDCPAEQASEPPTKEGKPKSIPAIQYELLAQSPYQYTQDDVLFFVHAQRNGLDVTDKVLRDAFLSKSHPCLRSSALGKRYGWGIHFDEAGKAALVAVESELYRAFSEGEKAGVNILKAMRNTRK